MDFLKNIGGKVAAGAVALAVVAAGISWWQADPSTRSMLLSGTGRILAWFGIVLIVPWATFFVIGRVGNLASNAAGAALVASYTLIEAIVLLGLFHWKLPTGTAWTFFAVGVLVAGVYNLFTCDWIAEKTE